MDWPQTSASPASRLKGLSACNHIKRCTNVYRICADIFGCLALLWAAPPEPRHLTQRCHLCRLVCARAGQSPPGQQPEQQPSPHHALLAKNVAVGNILQALHTHTNTEWTRLQAGEQNTRQCVVSVVSGSLLHIGRYVISGQQMRAGLDTCTVPGRQDTSVSCMLCIINVGQADPNTQFWNYKRGRKQSRL